MLDTHVDERAFLADALAVENVELGLLERRRDLVLDDLDASAVTHCVGTVLESFDTTDVEADRSVELQCLTTGGGFGRTEHHADLLAKLVDEDDGGARVVHGTGDLAQRLAHQSSLQTDVAVTHLAFDLGARNKSGHGVDHDDVEGA